MQQRRSVDLNTGLNHEPIVENAASVAARPAQSTVWRGEATTAAFARQLAARPAIADCFIELRGDLGAGKTTFARHLLRALGVSGRVRSPTYAVVEPYRVAWPQHLLPKNDANSLDLWHFDFYRFNDPREWEDAGFREIFASPGLKLAEWPQHAAALLPTADLVIELAPCEHDDTAREVRLTPRSAVGNELIE